MLLQSFKPSKKGLAHFSGDQRIFFLARGASDDRNYVFFRKTEDGYAFTRGDVFEWKPHLKKPDSFWEKAEMVETTAIKNSRDISRYNQEVYEVHLKRMGI